MLSGRDLCDGLITRPEESYRAWRLYEATLNATRQRIQSPASEIAASKLAMITACWSEKAGHRTCRALVVIRHFRDEEF